MKRKIIQLSWDMHGTLWALCDDGTVWFRFANEWRSLKPEIPQDSPASTN